jgi:hypothetical protein
VLLQVGVVERASQASHRFGPARSSWSSYRARTVAAMTSPVRPRSTGPSSRDVSSIPSVASAVAAALRSCSSFLPLDAEQVVDADLGGARVVTNSPVGFVPDDPDEALGPAAFVDQAKPVGICRKRTVTGRTAVVRAPRVTYQAGRTG